MGLKILRLRSMDWNLEIRYLWWSKTGCIDFYLIMSQRK